MVTVHCAVRTEYLIRIVFQAPEDQYAVSFHQCSVLIFTLKLRTIEHAGAAS
jgi:hypothetical protein